MQCEPTDFMYPMLADIYYPIVDQGAYGNVKKQWILDRSIACNFAPTGQAASEEVKPNVNITKENILLGRTKTDIRVSGANNRNSITNVVITNEAIVGPFGNIEYYKVVLRRSENQASDL